MFTPSPLKRILFFLLSDIIISLFTLYFAYNLRFNFQVQTNFINNFFLIFFVLFFIKIIVFIYFRLYRTAWRFFSLHEVKKILFAHIIIYISFFIIFLIFKDNMQPLARSIIIIDFLLSLVLVTLLRLSKRIILESAKGIKYKNTLIIGANFSVNSLLNDKTNKEYSPLAIVDGNEILIGTYISNIKVFGFKDLKKVIKNKNIEAVIISKEYSQKRLIEIYEILNELEINDIKILNTLSSNNKNVLKNIEVEDLLARHPKDLDKKQIENFIKNKIILITGAGGSIGSEISRKCVSFGAKQLILLDHSEYNLYSITEELKD